MIAAIDTWTMRSRLVAVIVLLALVGSLPALAVCARDGESLSFDALRAAAARTGQDGGAGTVTFPPSMQEPTPAPDPAPPPRRVPVSPVEVARGPVDVPKVSLIINAGSGYPPAEELLDILRAKGVTTTFFLMGWWAEGNADLVRRIDAEGHEIASHGYRVFELTRVSDAAVIEDLERAEAVLSGITGKTTKPLWSASASARDARVNGIAARLGYRPIYWTADSGDWRANATPESVLRLSLAGAVNGAIIVLHLDSPQSRSATATIFGRLIDTLRERGLEPVTITELVGE